MGILTKREMETVQALRQLMLAVEIAEDNNYSDTSRKALSAAADTAAKASVRYPVKCVGGKNA